MVIVATIWSQGAMLRQGPTRDTRRASSRGLIPRAKIKTVKMTFVIVFGKMKITHSKLISRVLAYVMIVETEILQYLYKKIEENF